MLRRSRRLHACPHSPVVLDWADDSPSALTKHRSSAGARAGTESRSFTEARVAVEGRSVILRLTTSEVRQVGAAGAAQFHFAQCRRAGQQSRQGTRDDTLLARATIAGSLRRRCAMVARRLGRADGWTRTGLPCSSRVPNPAIRAGTQHT